MQSANTGDFNVQGMVVALMVSNGFTEIEYAELQRALLKAGATLKTISCNTGLVNGWAGNTFGHYFPVDAQLSDILAADLDALIVPGGERSINKLKTNLNTARIVRNMVDAEKPVVLFGAAHELLAHAGRESTPCVSMLDSSADNWLNTTMAAVAAGMPADDMAAAA